MVSSQNGVSSETSPRAWSILLVAPTRMMRFRNISTCVEHTVALYVLVDGGEKHLHVRGAYPARMSDVDSNLETSPRAWSILL